ncbi:MAG TPA: T9SS type A sorting domain-containing protein, partial [Cytophagaceae bacterium]|nr:T9SS type A sorting domain-containing protein [Cytophagaceae bacterium]
EIVRTIGKTPPLGLSYGAGLEFSKDGSKIFYSGQGTQVYYFDIATATLDSVIGAKSWSMQLGPDGNIYTSPGGSATVGIISNTTTIPTYSTTAVTGSATLFRGLSNISWLNPSLPVISASSGCPTVNFSYVFSNYFNTAITVVAGSEAWDFGEGAGFQTGLGATPTHTFGNNSMTYNVRVRVTDSNCNQTWIGTKSVTLSCPAPVTLINFNGFKNEGGTKLVWNTASETNNDYFDIQRSADGINFYSIGQVKGKGSTSSISSYSFDDVSSNNIVYYRLAQYDIDGKITYSSIIIIKAENIAPVVSPNPFTNNFTVVFDGDKNVEIKVLDMLGRIVEKKTMAENVYSTTLGEELSKGSYIVCVTTDTENYYYKIIKE